MLGSEFPIPTVIHGAAPVDYGWPVASRFSWRIGCNSHQLPQLQVLQNLVDQQLIHGR